MKDLALALLAVAFALGLPYLMILAIQKYFNSRQKGYTK